MLPSGMIVDFRCEETRRIFRGQMSASFPPNIQQSARRKLRMPHAAVTIDDLRSPPGNRLEALKGDRSGQHSIRINDQYRLCFVWRDGNAHEVEIVDYH